MRTRYYSIVGQSIVDTLSVNNVGLSSRALQYIQAETVTMTTNGDRVKMDALHLAAYYDHVVIINYLTSELNFTIDRETNIGNTALSLGGWIILLIYLI